MYDIFMLHQSLLASVFHGALITRISEPFVNMFNVRSQVVFVGKNLLALRTVKAQAQMFVANVIAQIFSITCCELTFRTPEILRPRNVSAMALEINPWALL